MCIVVDVYSEQLNIFDASKNAFHIITVNTIIYLQLFPTWFPYRFLLGSHSYHFVPVIQSIVLGVGLVKQTQASLRCKERIVAHIRLVNFLSLH